jgi:sugar lactone lactonase YvrE
MFDRPLRARRLGVASLATLAVATAVSLTGPTALTGTAHAAVSSPSTAIPGTLFASDANGDRVRALAPDGTAYTVASGLPGTPYGVAADADGNVYIGDNNFGVIKVAPDGTRTTLPFTGLGFAFRVGVDGAGDVFVVDLNSRRVLELPADGSPQRTVPTPGVTSPFGLAVDQAGDAYVTDNSGGSAVIKVTPNGTVTSVGSGFYSPQGVTVDNDGNVYVADTNNGRVVKVAPDGTQSVIANDLTQPQTLTVDRAGSVYVYGYYYGGTMTRIDPDGTESQVAGLQTGYSYGLAVSPNARLAQSIVFTSKPPAAPAVGDRYDVTASAGVSGNAVVFSADASSTSTCAVVSHGDTTATVTLTGAGTCTIDAAQSGNRGYLAASAQQSFGVKANQAITFTSPAHRHQVGDTYRVTATGGKSGNPVTFALAPSTQGVCTVSSTGSVHFKHATRCTVVASQGGNTAFYAATKYKTLTVRRGTQNVRFTKTSGHHVDAHSSYTFRATGGRSHNDVRIHVTGACLVSPGGKVTFKHDGVCHVTAVQGGNADYLAGQAHYRVVVGS